MPHDSLHRRLGGGKDRFSEKENELLAHIAANGVATGIEFCAAQWQVHTSQAALGRWKLEIENYNCEQAALDKLSRRNDRTKKMSGKRRATLPAVSRENLELLDQRIFELQSALDLLGDDDEAVAKRKLIEERIEFYSDTLAKLAGAQKGDRDATTTETALKLKIREFEEKLASAKADLTKAISKGGITPETRAEIEERLKLL